MLLLLLWRKTESLRTSLTYFAEKFLPWANNCIRRRFGACQSRANTFWGSFAFYYVTSSLCRFKFFVFKKHFEALKSDFVTYWMFTWYLKFLGTLNHKTCALYSELNLCFEFTELERMHYFMMRYWFCPHQPEIKTEKNITIFFWKGVLQFFFYISMFLTKIKHTFERR